MMKVADRFERAGAVWLRRRWEEKRDPHIPRRKPLQVEMPNVRSNWTPWSRLSAGKTRQELTLVGIHTCPVQDLTGPRESSGFSVILHFLPETI